MTDIKIKESIPIKQGTKAPDFTLLDQNEKKVSLKDFKGKNIVLYFYPKDNTPGCTIEAQDFTRLRKEFEKHNSLVLGISKDSCKSHQEFINKQKLNVLLLSDPETQVQKLYGVWRKKKFMGKEFLGTIRSTFLIDSKGKVLKVWDSVNAQGHAEDVLEELKK